MISETSVERRLADDVPASIARALLVCGFSDENAHAAAVLERFSNARGFIGRAHAAAQYAYERNVWARRWYAKMITTERSEEFWRYSILLAKIVDGRYSLWLSEFSPTKTTFANFISTVKATIERRIQSWRDKRRDKLFGEKAPSIYFMRKAKSN
jgi:hypothetical protein